MENYGGNQGTVRRDGTRRVRSDQRNSDDREESKRQRLHGRDLPYRVSAGICQNKNRQVDDTLFEFDPM